MYLPPFWFHHVQALEPSVSVNVWSNSAAANDFQHALKDPAAYLPELEGLGLVADQATHLYCLQAFLSLVVQACGLRLPDFTSLLLANHARAAGPLPPGRFECGAMGAGGRAAAAPVLRRHAEALHRASFGRMPPDVVLPLAASFVESLLAEFVGAGNVHAFIRDCLA